MMITDRKTDENVSKSLKTDPNYVIMWFKKWISDIKFHQNNDKLTFPMIFIDFYITYGPKMI